MSTTPSHSNSQPVHWKVEGMNCTNCALTISKFLEEKGLPEVRVNFIGGDVSFQLPEGQEAQEIRQGIQKLGYQVADENAASNTGSGKQPFFKSHFHRFMFCLPFTLILMLHMFHWSHENIIGHILMNPWYQLLICLPVYGVGMGYFGSSAIRSLLKGIPNMNVLVATGATAAFIYSLIGSWMNLGMDYIFYETTATIITLVFLGEYLEHRSISITQESFRKLEKQQKVMANMIAFDDQHQELIFPVENTQLKPGDLVLIKTGEQVPADCKILWGDVQVSEALLTGESRPIAKKKKDLLIGGSLITDGNAKAQVTAVGKDTVLSSILDMVKHAQSEKPPVQQLADKISAVFVPLVIGIGLLTFAGNYWIAGTGVTAALMRSIAVLVISCPCAMGLATPAAIAVGLGRGARNGVLFRNARSLEVFKNIRTVVFDKTGTLTLGEFRITEYQCGSLTDDAFRKIIYSLEKYSNHPIAKAICIAWKRNDSIQWAKIEEIKGYGIKATDTNGNEYLLGAGKFTNHEPAGNLHTAYLQINGRDEGWFDVADELRPESRIIIQQLHAKGIKTILLSGDSQERCQPIAQQLGISELHAGKTPEEKLQLIEQFTREAPTAMVGDGINDAPALAKSTIGISMSEATQLAMQSAQVVLVKNGLKNVPFALGLGKATYATIRGNLFWAFIYNIVAIPVAAFGFLNPGIAALTMGFSDVVLAINSIRLNYKKLD